MPDDVFRRRNRLTKRAKELDEVIKKAAAMQKKILTEMQRIGKEDAVVNKRPTATPSVRTKVRRK